jgi:hypothetical protein
VLVPTLRLFFMTVAVVAVVLLVFLILTAGGGATLWDGRTSRTDNFRADPA